VTWSVGAENFSCREIRLRARGIDRWGPSNKYIIRLHSKFFGIGWAGLFFTPQTGWARFFFTRAIYPQTTWFARGFNYFVIHPINFLSLPTARGGGKSGNPVSTERLQIGPARGNSRPRPDLGGSQMGTPRSTLVYTRIIKTCSFPTSRSINLEYSHTGSLWAK